MDEGEGSSSSSGRVGLSGLRGVRVACADGPEGELAMYPLIGDWRDGAGASRKAGGLVGKHRCGIWGGFVSCFSRLRS